MTQPKTVRQLADVYLDDHHMDQGPCLVPKPDSKYGMTCHERDYCECEMIAAFGAGHTAGIARCLELLRGSDPSDSHALNPENGFLELCETGIEWSAWLESQMKDGGVE